MTLIQREVDTLRGRFSRLRGQAAPDADLDGLGVHRNTVRRFLRGGLVNEATLYAIERWCDKQEGAAHDTPH